VGDLSHYTKKLPLIGMVQTASEEDSYGAAILTRWAAEAVRILPD